MSAEATKQHAVGCAVTFTMSSAAARALAEELLLLARESDQKGQLVTVTVGGDASALEVSP